MYSDAPGYDLYAYRSLHNEQIYEDAPHQQSADVRLPKRNASPRNNGVPTAHA